MGNKKSTWPERVRAVSTTLFSEGAKNIPVFPGMFSRLDKQTSGVMLLARNPEVAWKIHGMFKRREVSRDFYCAETSLGLYRKIGKSKNGNSGFSVKDMHVDKF